MSDATQPVQSIFFHSHSRYAEHVAPVGHPESPARLQAVDEGVQAARDAGVHLESVDAEPAEDETLLRAHTAAHVALVAEACETGADIDHDTYTSPSSDEVARYAVGAAVALGRAVLGDGASRSGFAAVRPPGHHAERERAMGFCLYSTVAAAALELQARGLVERVAIVDWDVHHGNGTEDVLRDRADLLYVSIHQYPLYPGTGSIDDRGAGDGLGWTANLPLPAGARDGEYLYMFDRVVLPLLRACEPDLVFVSAGYDAHQLDPLANMRLSSRAFGQMAARLMSLGRPVAAVLEGGYDPTGLAEGVEQTLRALAGIVAVERGAAPHGIAERVADAALERLHEQWPNLAP